MGEIHEIGRFFLFTGAGFLAGLINTLASSGSAVTLPLLVFMGLPANVANGTNRVQLFIGRLASVVAFQRAGAIDWHRGLILCLPVLSGGIGGAYLASVISPDDIGRAITVAVFISLILILSSAKKLLIGHAEASPRLKWWHWPLFFLAGGWAGFVVLDSFTYYILLLVLCVGYDLTGANGIKCLFSVIVSGASLIIFSAHQEVDWYLGFSMSGGSIAGSWLGALLSTREWIKVWIYRLLLVMISLEICLLFPKYFWPR